MPTRLSRTAICGLAILFAPATVSADQFAWVSPEEGARAVEFIRSAGTVRVFCKPCGDRTVRRLEVESVAVHAIEGESAYVEVRVNDEPLDLAYVYLPEGEPPKWRNLALRLGLDPVDVPERM